MGAGGHPLERSPPATFRVQDAFQDSHCGRLIYHRTSRTDGVTGIPQPSGCRRRGQPFVGEEHRNGAERARDLARTDPYGLSRRPVTAGQITRQTDDDRHRFVLGDEPSDLRKWVRPCGDGLHRVREQPLAIACRDPDPRAAEIER